MNKIRAIINANLTNGSKECLVYGMHSWVVTHSIYPQVYHVSPYMLLSFMNIAS